MVELAVNSKPLITVWLNNEALKIAEHTSLSEAIDSWQFASRTFAIAVNEQFVPKNAYPSTLLKERDRIELLEPMQGG